MPRAPKDPKKPEGKVLIIDDDPFISDIFGYALTRDGFRVVLVGDGKSGLTAVKKERPDAILLDIMMPDMNGFAVLRELKSDAVTKDIPIIMLTNLGQRSDIDRGKREGAFDYLIKTMTVPEAVTDAVRRSLGKSTSEKK